MSGMHRDRMKRRGRLRLLVQLAFAALLNGYAAGFAGKTLYTGGVKRFCVPVLNCYSCPGALGACPIGALQTVVGRRGRVPFYVLGVLMLFGVLVGRTVCGFVCPFGLVQDLLYRLPVPKLRVPRRLDRALRWVKYAVLALVLLLPALLTDGYGNGAPWFCKYLCPAGTLLGGIPQLLLHRELRGLAGGLFWWKLAVLLAVLAAAAAVSRCFCRYLCPLGAFYAVFSRVTVTRMTLDPTRCTSCGTCDAVCPMALHVPTQLSGAECIRCGRCTGACPHGAIGGARPAHPQTKGEDL